MFRPHQYSPFEGAPLKKIIRYCYYLLALAFSKLVLLIPYRIALRIGGCLGGIAYAVIPDARKTVEDNLRRSFPDMPADKVRVLARQVFVNQGKNLFELFSFPKLSKEDILRTARIENRGVMDRALASGKGVLIASAHCGNWEMMGAALSLTGFPINVIARRIYIEGLNRMLVGFRSEKGERVVLRSGQESARQILRALRRNETLAMLIDQDTDVPGVFVNFFSRPAWTPSGLATLAMRTGAVVILALDVRQPDETHRVMLQGPLEVKNTGDNEKDVVDTTQMITTMIEEHIRQYPSQWVWMHRRWKTQKV